jgi:hypothetical protein
MPIYPGGPRAGAGLWNSMAGTVIVECALYAVGLWLYVRATRARDRIGRWAFGSLAVALVLIYFGNLAGPPPPSVMAIAVIGLVGGALILVWAWWADRHREVVLR